MSPRLSRRAVLGLAVALVVAATGVVRAQERKEGRSDAPKGARAGSERASGVIVKVEPGKAKEGEERPNVRRVTINLAAVWRDWARDQVLDSTKSPAKDAAQGANSVATKGQPVAKETLVVVEVGPETRIETRYRLVSDETSRGEKTPEAARSASADPAAKSEPGTRKGSDGRPMHFTARDLKAGLFVEVDFHEKSGRGAARTVSVIRPVE